MCVLLDSLDSLVNDSKSGSDMVRYEFKTNRLYTVQMTGERYETRGKKTS